MGLANDYILALVVLTIVSTVVYVGYTKYIEKQREKKDPGWRARQERRRQAAAEKQKKAQARNHIISGVRD